MAEWTKEEREACSKAAWDLHNLSGEMWQMFARSAPDRVKLARLCNAARQQLSGLMTSGDEETAIDEELG